MKSNKISRLFALLFVLLIFISGCTSSIPSNNQTNNSNNDNIIVGNTSNLGSEDLKKFSSEEELMNFIKEQAMNSESSNIAGYGLSNVRFKTVDVAMETTSDIVTISADTNEAAGSSDYSKTNVQVEGVDEADIVKNDGKYIYVVSQNKVVIVDAYPVEDAKSLSTINFANDNMYENVQDIFIYGNKLVVFTNKNDIATKVSSYSFIPQETYIDKTHIYIYDTTNKNKPELLKDYSVSGNYYDARLIGDYVYLISKEYNYYWRSIGIPELYDGQVKIAMPDIYYFDRPYSDYNFHTIASINMDSLDIDAKSFMLGSSSNLYVSENNIYITSQKYYSLDIITELKEVVVPLLPSNVQKQIKDVLDENLGVNKALEKITTILENMYNSMDEDEKKDLVDEISKKTQEYEEKIESESRKTIIHKISIKNGKIEYDTKGEVNGYLLNQFSLDENDKEELRAATTTTFWTRDNGQVQYNNVYVLDDDLNVIGSLENIAEDERIYSTRFMGDKLYMVTFKQIDPLFVVDLSDSKNPEILGKLKIPGYSTYLHPYDESHLIGIGYDTKESEWGGIVNNGVKLSLFDISDFENPKEVDSYIIDGRYTDSVALHEHKAFLFNKEKELLVLPVREYIDSINTGISSQRYNAKYKQGAYVFTITKDGFDLRGVVEHEEEEGYNYWYYSSSDVLRTLYIDDVLYTISQKKILMNDMNSLDDINEVDLGYSDSEDRYYYY